MTILVEDRNYLVQISVGNVLAASQRSALLCCDPEIALSTAASSGWISPDTVNLYKPTSSFEYGRFLAASNSRNSGPNVALVTPMHNVQALTTLSLIRGPRFDQFLMTDDVGGAHRNVQKGHRISLAIVDVCPPVGRTFVPADLPGLKLAQAFIAKNIPVVLTTPDPFLGPLLRDNRIAIVEKPYGRTKIMSSVWGALMSPRETAKDMLEGLAAIESKTMTLFDTTISEASAYEARAIREQPTSPSVSPRARTLRSLFIRAHQLA